MKAKVDTELMCLQNEGIIEPVQFSDWAIPIVPVLKADGNVRICGDYISTANLESLVDQYLNYFGRFLPNLSSELAPLHQLLHKNAKFLWERPQRLVFQRSKQLLKKLII